MHRNAGAHDDEAAPAARFDLRRERLKAARLQRSSFEAVRRPSGVADRASIKSEVKTGDLPVTSVKMGVRPSGGGHIHAEVYEEMRALDEVKRRELRVATAQFFDDLSLRARHRLAEQDLLLKKWSSRSAEQQMLHQGIRILKRRKDTAEKNSQTMLQKCADLLGSWLKNTRVQQEAPKGCEEMAKDVAIYQQEMLRFLHKLLPETDPCPQPFRGIDVTNTTTTQLRAGFAVQLDMGKRRREHWKQTRTKEDAQQQSECEPGDPGDEENDEESRQESEPDGEDCEAKEEMQQRVAAAMELLDVHEPKAVKVRMAGLKPSAIHDEDTFKRLIAEKFAEAINLDTDQIRIRRLSAEASDHSKRSDA
eukprot:Skav234688  [mRNA]  locus=scaffold3643:108675:109766:- [translate_table: standard]